MAIVVIALIWIGLAAMRFSTRLTAYTGVLSIATYVLVVLVSMVGGSVELGTITEAYTTARVSPMNVTLNVMFLVGVSFIAVQGGDNLVGSGRLGQVMHGAELDGLHGGRHAGETGQHDNARVLVQRGQLRAQNGSAKVVHAA